GFHDGAQREYHLTPDSPALHAGIDPGSAHDVPLAPAYEFAYPASGVPRPASGVLDLGAYQYRPDQNIPAAPAITVAGTTPVDYDSTATLKWSVTQASYCTAVGDWSGPLALSGSYTTPKLTSEKNY